MPGKMLKRLSEVCCPLFWQGDKSKQLWCKQAALDEESLAKWMPSEDLLQKTDGGEYCLNPDQNWLTGINPQRQLTFLGVSDEAGSHFGILLEIDVGNDRLLYLPLPGAETPLTILNNPDQLAIFSGLIKSYPLNQDRFANTRVKEISLREILKKLIPPIPIPNQIFAVAANYPSHLFSDLSLKRNSQVLDRLRQARPRLFRKYPPVSPPGMNLPVPSAYNGLLSPFDTIVAPEQVLIPTEVGRHQAVSGHIDYEVEVAALIGRNLTWEEAQRKSDLELRQFVSGYLLFSDAKVRDPQAMDKILQTFKVRPLAHDNVYRIGVAALDGALGIWDKVTCHWWSYAASWGRYATAGPFLVSAPEDGSLPARMIISGRSYSSANERPFESPPNLPHDRLLLRQATVTTNENSYTDALIWDIPAIIRSLLNPDQNALAFMGEKVQLYAGDLISLGTPGGTVITAKPWWMLPLAKNILLWKKPKSFYDSFFKEASGGYLQPGDELFLWGEGLGYQHLRVSKNSFK